MGSQKHLGHRTWEKAGPAARGRAGLGINKKLCPEGQGGWHHWDTALVTPPGTPSVLMPLAQTRWLRLRMVWGPHAAIPLWCWASQSGPSPAQLACLLGLSTYLDALDALSDDVGMVHGHQRDLDSRHPAHTARPHSCGQSTAGQLCWHLLGAAS